MGAGGLSPLPLTLTTVYNPLCLVHLIVHSNLSVTTAMEEAGFVPTLGLRYGGEVQMDCKTRPVENDHSSCV